MENNFNKEVKMMNCDEGFIINPLTVKLKLEEAGFEVVIVKNNDKKQKLLVLVHQRDIPNIKKKFKDRYYILNEKNIEY